MRKWRWVTRDRGVETETWTTQVTVWSSVKEPVWDRNQGQSDITFKFTCPYSTVTLWHPDEFAKLFGIRVKMGVKLKIEFSARLSQGAGNGVQKP